jgi:hypothetical protein
LLRRNRYDELKLHDERLAISKMEWMKNVGAGKFGGYSEEHLLAVAVLPGSSRIERINCV